MKFLEKIKSNLLNLVEKVKDKIKNKTKFSTLDPTMNIIVDTNGISYFILDGRYDAQDKTWRFKGFVLARVYHNRSTLGEILTKISIEKRHSWSAYIRDILEYAVPISDMELSEDQVVYILKLDNKSIAPPLEQFENLFDRKMRESMSNIGASITAEDADHINPNSLMSYKISVIDRCLIIKEFTEKFNIWGLAAICS